MSLVWHIVCKDFRRLAGPVGLWLLLVLGHVLLLFVWEGQMGSSPAAFEGKRYFVNTCEAIVKGIGFVLAAWLVMEDSLVSTRAFWRTRALSGGRLLAAKVLGAFLMFSVLPAVALTPVWLGCGFSLREITHAAFELGMAQALCSLAAFAMGSITETSGQFLVRLVGALIVLPAYLAYLVGSFSKGGGPDETRSFLLAAVFVSIPLVMTVHQFLTRRTRRTWVLFLVGLGLMLVAGRWWPWNFMAGGQPRPGRHATTAPTFTAHKLVENPLHSLHWRTPLHLEGRVTGLSPGTLVRVDRVQGWWIGGAGWDSGVRLTGAVTTPTVEDVRQVAGLSAPGRTEAAWSAHGKVPEEMLRANRDGRLSLKLDGTVRATVMRGAVLGELPLRAGATLTVGSSHTRIKSVRWVEGHVVVLIEERDAWISSDSRGYSHSHEAARRRLRPAEDGFVVLNRGQKLDLMPGVQEIGTMMTNSIVVGRRNLVITPPESPGEEGGEPDWLEEAVLVKVRFSPGERIVRTLAGEPLAVTR